MMTRSKIVLASAAAVVLLGAAGGAVAKRGESGAREDRVNAMFEMLDANNDDRVTRAEAEAFRDQKFGEFDADGSGELSMAEYTALVNSFRAERMQRRFERQDADNSGGLARTELAGRMDRLFAWLDKNEDGAVERAELEEGRNHRGRHSDN